MRPTRFWMNAAALSAAFAMAVPGVSAQQGGRPAAPRPAAPTAPATAARPAAPVPPKLDGYKKEVLADVDNMSVFTQQMIDQVFSYGELGFQEFETSKYLTDILKKNGFTIQENLAGIPTAWMASWVPASRSSRSARTSTIFRRRRRSRASPGTNP